MEENDVANESSEMILKESKTLPKGLQPNRMKKTTTNVGDSRVSAGSSKNVNEKYENTVAHLNNMINK